MIPLLIGGIGGLARFAAGAAFGGYLVYQAMIWFVVPAAEEAAREGYVKEVRAVAAEAKAAELERQIKAGQDVIDAYQAQLRLAYDREEKTRDEAEQQISEYEKAMDEATRACRGLRPADLDFLRK